jgi:hypothetical protein
MFYASLLWRGEAWSLLAREKGEGKTPYLNLKGKAPRKTFANPPQIIAASHKFVARGVFKLGDFALVARSSKSKPNAIALQVFLICFNLNL